MKFTEALVDDVKGMKIGIPKDYFGEGLDSEVKEKIMAAVKFARRFPGKKAIITSLYKAVDALEGDAGTVITMA